MLVRRHRCIKYWFSITDDEQRSFLGRIHDPLKQ